LKAEYLDDAARTVLADFAQKAGALPEWSTEALAALIKSTLADHGIKMPKLGLPLRLAVTGHKQTPAIDAVLAILGRDRVVERLAAV
jgi:glutamyl-tRNA synthetase